MGSSPTSGKCMSDGEGNQVLQQFPNSKRLTADQQVPGSNPGVPLPSAHGSAHAPCVDDSMHHMPMRDANDARPHALSCVLSSHRSGSEWLPRCGGGSRAIPRDCTCIRVLPKSARRRETANLRSHRADNKRDYAVVSVAEMRRLRT